MKDRYLLIGLVGEDSKESLRRLREHKPEPMGDLLC